MVPVKATHTDPEDDGQADPSGSTSKTWDPYTDRNFWPKKSSSADLATCASSMSSKQWRPKLRADRDTSSVAGDTSEGSTSVPRLECIDEFVQFDAEALREMQERVTQALARKGSS